MDRVETVRNYLQAGKSVCPFAKVSPLELVTVSTIPRADRAIIIPSVVAFAAARGNALVLLAEADANFTATTAWATEAFLELMVCCSWLDQPMVPIAEVERHVERDIRPILDSPVLQPHLGLRAKALMSICMAPVYPAAHPRYAPHTILVVTWIDDVAAAQSTNTVAKIRAAMAREHGSVYDANELMLPLPATAAKAVRKLKMWVGNYDGDRQGLVIATSKDSARKIAGVGRTNFDNYWVQQPEADQALEPGVLYTRAFTYSEPAPWYRGRCPLPSREPS
jgi:hypothetical protein